MRQKQVRALRGKGVRTHCRAGRAMTSLQKEGLLVRALPYKEAGALHLVHLVMKPLERSLPTCGINLRA